MVKVAKRSRLKATHGLIFQGAKLAEMNVSLEQLAGLEEKEEEESGSSVHGSETCLREY